MSEYTSKLQVDKVNIERVNGVVVEIREDCTIFHSTSGRDATTLDLPVSFIKNDRGWQVDFNVSDSLPVQKTMDEAAKKLGDWLIRAGTALKDNNPENLDLNSISVFHRPINRDD